MKKKLIACDFDFKPAMLPFARVLDDKHYLYDPSQAYAAKLWLKMPYFSAYLMHCLKDPDFWEQLEIYTKHQKNQYRASTDITHMELYKEFASVNFSHKNTIMTLSYPIDNNDHAFPTNSLPKGKAVRKTTVYPLGYDETELSVDFIEKHMDFEYAFVAIKMCLLDYFSLMRQTMKQTYGFDPNESKSYSSQSTSQRSLLKGFRTLWMNAIDFSMLQDFMPLIANTLRQSEDTFAPKALHRSFAEAFRRQAFQSMGRNGYKKCPFAQSLTKLMSISFSKDGDGNYIAKEDDFPGALIISMRDYIRDNFLQALPKTHAVFQIRL